MSPLDIKTLEFIRIGELAFYLSPYAKHGDTGRERFLPNWSKKYIKKYDSRTRKLLKSLITKYSIDPKTFTNIWNDTRDTYEHAFDIIAHYHGMSDKDRFQYMEENNDDEIQIIRENDSLGENYIPPLDSIFLTQGALKYDSQGNIPKHHKASIFFRFSSQDKRKTLVHLIQTAGFKMLNGNQIATDEIQGWEITSAHYNQEVNDKIQSINNIKTSANT